MRQEWMDIFFQEGYRFCKVKPEETGVFYKYYEEGFHLVMLIDAGAGCLPTPEQRDVMYPITSAGLHHILSQSRKPGRSYWIHNITSLRF